ncbi:MAG: hypothetical protein M1115_09515 [Actinobacteria bacterium]|nr:hypothetical protein [Actinomycetota bacterium]
MDQSVSPPSFSEELSKELASAKIQFVEGLGHWLALEAASIVIELIAKFIDEKSTIIAFSDGSHHGHKPPLSS